MQIKNIRTKFLMSLLPLFIISFVILSGVSYYLAKGHLTNSVNETAMAIGEKFSTQIHGEMHDNILHLEDIASFPQIQAGNQEEQLAVLSAAKSRLKEFDAMVLISLDGQGLGADGKRNNYSDRDYFIQVKQTKQVCISKPLISKTTGKLSVALAVPVMTAGQMTSILEGTVSLEKLSAMLKDLHFKETGYGYLADSSGLVIAHHKAPEMIGKLNLTEKKINAELKYSQTELDDRLINLFKTALEGGKAVQGLYTTVFGVPGIAVFTPIELDGGGRWVMVVTAPEAEVTKAIAMLTQAMLWVSLLFIAIAIIFIVIFSNRLAKPIQLLRDECLVLTNGDLREQEAKIFSADEIGQLAEGFRSMRANVRDLVTQIQSQAELVAASSEELTASAEQSSQAANQVAVSITEVAQGAENQLNLVNSTTRFVEQISASIGQVAQNAAGVSVTAEKTSTAANEGEKAIEKAVNQMAIIEQKTMNTAKVIGELEEKSRQIGQIVEAISSIAGQTNLLALNAAIEAARAGAQGRGFAVVAEEVRKLAEQSQEATKEIASLIEEVQQKTSNAVLFMSEGRKEVTLGSEVVGVAGKSFQDILLMIREISGQLGEISAAIQEVTAGSKAVVSSVNEIDKESSQVAKRTETVAAATQEQSASIEEIASSSHSLAKLAEDLQGATRKFKI
ncbi:MAG: methyl-accepting chemotaxis protein [Pelosinus sp.]|nr:methyl-accepting chemotaxis protein [Pelosinus sp.]